MATKQEDIQYIRKKVEKEMHHLRELYSEIVRIQSSEGRISRGYRLKDIESEFRRKYPDVEVDRSLLRLVGSMKSYNPPSKDKQLIQKAIAEHYE